MFLFWRFYARAAKNRRKKGYYDHVTLDYFRRAYKQKPTSRNLLNYLRFRRDLGCQHNMRRLLKLAPHIKSSAHNHFRFLVNAFTEAGEESRLNSFSCTELTELSEHSPSVAMELDRRGVELSEFSCALASMQREQIKYLAQFSVYIARHKNSICIVGNSSSIEGSQLGQVIDDYSVVFRFNHFIDSERIQESNIGAHSESSLSDIGNRLDVWSMSPDLQFPYPRLVGNSEWIILSGPDIRFQLGDWSNVVPLLNNDNKVLSVPLRIWRSLVRELKAPPSAGILCIAWVIDILGTPNGVSIAGFQREQHYTGRYHYALKEHRSSGRHNWDGERQVLMHWERRGLRFLT